MTMPIRPGIKTTIAATATANPITPAPTAQGQRRFGEIASIDTSELAIALIGAGPYGLTWNSALIAPADGNSPLTPRGKPAAGVARINAAVDGAWNSPLLPRMNSAVIGRWYVPLIARDRSESFASG